MKLFFFVPIAAKTLVFTKREINQEIARCECGNFCCDLRRTGGSTVSVVRVTQDACGVSDRETHKQRSYERVINVKGAKSTGRPYEAVADRA